MKNVVRLELQLKSINQQISEATKLKDTYLVARLYVSRTEILLSLVEAQKRVIDGRFSWLTG